MTTSAKTDAEARELLALFGFPFKKRPVKAETAEEKS